MIFPNPPSCKRGHGSDLVEIDSEVLNLRGKPLSFSTGAAIHWVFQEPPWATPGLLAGARRQKRRGGTKIARARKGDRAKTQNREGP
jgi:hypothetical protein